MIHGAHHGLLLSAPLRVSEKHLVVTLNRKYESLKYKGLKSKVVSTKILNTKVLGRKS